MGLIGMKIVPVEPRSSTTLGFVTTGTYAPPWTGI